MQNHQKTLLMTLKKTLQSGYGKALLAAAIVFVFWLPFMVMQIANIQGGGFWIHAVDLNTIPNLISNMYIYHDSSATQGWLAVLVMGVFAATAYIVWRAYHTYTGYCQRVYLLFIMMSILPPVFLILGSMPPLRSSFVDRYVLASIAMWFIVTGIAVSRLWERNRYVNGLKVFSLLLMVALLIGCFEVYSVGNLNKDNGSIHTMRRAMELTNSLAKGDEPIIADTSWRYFEAAYYAKSSHTVYFRSEDDTKVGAYEMLRGENDHKIVAMDNFGETHPVVWFMTAQARNEQSKIPSGWQELKTYLVDSPSELRLVEMKFVGTHLTGK